MGFFKIEEPTTVSAFTPWLRVKGTATNPPLPQYFLTKGGIPSAVKALPSATDKADEIYDLNGRRVESGAMKSGKIYIVNGEKRRK